MDKDPSWKVDIQSLSSVQLVELIRKLEGGNCPEIVLEARRELVQRLRDQGATIRVIVKTILSNIAGKRARERVAKKWEAVLEIDQKEIMRIYES